MTVITAWTASRCRIIVLAVLLVLCAVNSVDGAQRSGGSAAPPTGPHPADWKTCPTCAAALKRIDPWMQKHRGDYGNPNGSIFETYYGGFYFMFAGDEAGATQCAKAMNAQIAKKRTNPDYDLGGYGGWCMAYAGYYLAEYSLRYGVTPEAKLNLEWLSRFIRKSREPEGGWFHYPKWGEPNYAIDISTVGCTHFATVLDMKTMGLDTEKALPAVWDYAERVCDGQSVAYGLMGRGGFALCASSHLLLGLTSSGQQNDPRVKGIGAFLTANWQHVHRAHACGYLQHVGVAMGLHRVGAEVYGSFANDILHRRLLPQQHQDGGFAGPWPNDTKDEEMMAKYTATAKETSDAIHTAIIGIMILLEKPGTFAPLPTKRGGLPNAECLKKGDAALATGDAGQAATWFGQVLPGGGSPEQIPRGQQMRRRIEILAAKLVQEQNDTLATAVAAADPGTADGAAAQAEAYARTQLECEVLQKLLQGLPQANDAKLLASSARTDSGRLLAKQGPAVSARLKELEKTRKERIDAAEAAFRKQFQALAEPTEGGGANLQPMELPLAVQPDPAQRIAHASPAWRSRLHQRLADTSMEGWNRTITEYGSTRSITVLGVPDTTHLDVQLPDGSRVRLPDVLVPPGGWSSLALDLALRTDRSDDHALAAFFLLADGDQTRAQTHLLHSGAQRNTLADLFGASP